MGLNKPTFKVNVAASKKSTERKTLFLDIKPDTSVRLRILPPVTEDGMIFAKAVNHFKLKNEEGFGLALACLDEHGDENTGTSCYLCNLVKMLRNGDKADKKIADDLRASPRWYAQAMVYDKAEGTYFGPKLVGLSKTTAEAINDILVAQEESGDDYFCDPENGQDIVITRRGSGLNTKYSVMPTGEKMPLSDVASNWEETIIRDVYAALELKLEDPDGQKRAVYRTFEDELDWEKIQDQIG
jgi:hypothetical protein